HIHKGEDEEKQTECAFDSLIGAAYLARGSLETGLATQECSEIKKLSRELIEELRKIHSDERKLNLPFPEDLPNEHDPQNASAEVDRAVARAKDVLSSLHLKHITNSSSGGLTIRSMNSSRLRRLSEEEEKEEELREGPGKRSCKRSLDQTSGSSSSNQNSGALSDWLPGATVQTLAETYVSYIIAVLSCLSQRGSSQGIDEPAASCWAQESPKLSITRSADWRAKPWVAARHGTTATFLEVVQLLQLHLPVPSQEPLLWSFSSRPWFAVAYFLFGRLRSSDFVNWLQQWDTWRSARSNAVLLDTKLAFEAVSELCMKLMPKEFVVRKRGESRWHPVALPSHKFCAPRRVQLNLCKLAQVCKSLYTGHLVKPRQFSSFPVSISVPGAGWAAEGLKRKAESSKEGMHTAERLVCSEGLERLSPRDLSTPNGPEERPRSGLERLNPWDLSTPNGSQTGNPDGLDTYRSACLSPKDLSAPNLSAGDEEVKSDAALSGKAARNSFQAVAEVCLEALATLQQKRRRKIFAKPQTTEAVWSHGHLR
ncbi:unnamed protein product, partial [Cladocopium goreaui]